MTIAPCASIQSMAEGILFHLFSKIVFVTSQKTKDDASNSISSRSDEQIRDRQKRPIT